MRREVANRIAVAIGVGLAFGGLDQYLGSSWPTSHLGAWTVALSATSAPWLALPFVFGCREERAHPAAVVGLVVTMAAVAGYILLTNSPIEGVALGRLDVGRALSSQAHVILPGLVTGPAFGWLGHRWRTSRSVGAAALVAGAFCFEPLVARIAHSLPIVLPSPPPAGVSLFEIVVGLACAGYFARSRSRRAARP